jgi:hypothetical protein
VINAAAMRAMLCAGGRLGAAAGTCYLLTRDEEGDGTRWVPRHKQRGKVVG